MGKCFGFLTLPLSRWRSDSGAGNPGANEPLLNGAPACVRDPIFTPKYENSPIFRQNFQNCKKMSSLDARENVFPFEEADLAENIVGNVEEIKLEISPRNSDNFDLSLINRFLFR